MAPAPRILAAIVAVADRLDAAGVEWLLTGGAARALLGAARRPADVDLEVDAPDIGRAAAALGFSGVRREEGGGVASLRAGGRLAGVELDVSADVAVRGPAGALAPDWALQRRWSIPLSAAGRSLLAAPPEEMLVRALVREDRRRAAKLLDGDGPAPRAAYLAARLSAAISSATS